MKKQCEQTRKQLRRYLRGHVFAPERKRIEHHLKTCLHCATEYQSLRRSDETTRFLKEITPPEGVVQKMKTGVLSLSSIKKILYRPHWILIIGAAGFVLYQYVINPYLHEQEREWRELTAPSAPAVVSTPAPPVPAAAVAPAPAPGESKQAETAAAPAARKGDPLVVTITVEEEQGMRRINDVMRGHGVLRTKRFSDTVKEIPGDLTAKELLTFFNRIETVARISYSRSRLEAFPSAQPLPFVLRLKTIPRPAVKANEGASGASGEAPAPKAAESGPQTNVEQTVPKPALETPPAR